MNIALIVSDPASKRSAYKIALEIDERLDGLGLPVSIIDLQDESYHKAHIGTFDTFVFISENEGPLYDPAIHAFLIKNRPHWRKSQIASIFITDDKLVAEAADLSLKSNLRALGAQVFAEQMIIENAEDKFNNELELTDPQLNLMMYRFLFLLVYGYQAPDQRKTA